MLTFFSGILFSLSLILPIGVQNAFVLKQSLKQQNIFIICLICALSDTILFGVGIYSFAIIVKTISWLENIFKYGGALFVCVYGLNCLLKAYKNNYQKIEFSQTNKSLFKTITICLIITWLNPHAYLDTVVLMGLISTKYSDQKFWFYLGASFASFCFFFSLGYGAKFLSPIFQSKTAWRILDIIIAIIMFTIAISIVFL